MSKLERMESEYALLKMEEEFVQKKAAGQITVEDRLQLRLAREAFRLHHRVPAVEGAQPPVLGAKTKWQRIMEVLREE